MFCGNCGTENADTGKFCKSCGANLSAQAGKVESSFGGFQLIENDTDENVQSKLDSQEVLKYFPLRDGEEVLEISSFQSVLERAPSKRSKAIFLICYLLLCFMIIPINNYDNFNISLTGGNWGGNIAGFFKKKEFYEKVEFYVRAAWGLSLCIIPFNRAFLKAKVASERQVLLVTNQRILGRGAGIPTKVSSNQTLMNVPIDSYYTMESSKQMDVHRLKVEYGEEKRVFYGLLNADLILKKIEEVRNAEEFYH